MKSQGILKGCPNVKVSPLLKFNLIAVSAKMLYQEVMENSLRLGRSQGILSQKRGDPVKVNRS